MSLSDPEVCRRVIAERLSDIGVDLVHSQNEIWRVIHKYRAGLGRKEYEHLLLQIVKIKEAQHNIHRVTERCLHDPTYTVRDL